MDQPADDDSFAKRFPWPIGENVPADHLIEELRDWLNTSFPDLVLSTDRSWLKLNFGDQVPVDVIPAFLVETKATTPTVTKPTLPEWFYALPCGQQLAVIVVILLVVLSVELPHDVQDQIWGLITTLGAAIWVIQKITKS